MPRADKAAGEGMHGSDGKVYGCDEVVCAVGCQVFSPYVRKNSMGLEQGPEQVRFQRIPLHRDRDEVQALTVESDSRFHGGVCGARKRQWINTSLAQDAAGDFDRQRGQRPAPKML